MWTWVGKHKTVMTFEEVVLVTELRFPGMDWTYSSIGRGLAGLQEVLDSNHSINWPWWSKIATSAMESKSKMISSSGLSSATQGTGGQPGLYGILSRKKKEDGQGPSPFPFLINTLSCTKNTDLLGLSFPVRAKTDYNAYLEPLVRLLFCTMPAT